MTPRNFDTDLTESNTPTLRQAWVRLLRTRFGPAATVEFKDELRIQVDFRGDAVVSLPSGRRFFLELKTRRHSYQGSPLWCMELFHHVYVDELCRERLYSREGWVYSSMADLLVFATKNVEGSGFVEAVMWDIMPFKCEAWKSEFKKYDLRFAAGGTVFESGRFQKTGFVLVPQSVIQSVSPNFWEWRV